MTTSSNLRELAVEGLKASGATAAGTNVYSPRTWATWDLTYPVLLVQTPDESGTSWGPNGAPAFTVTTTVRVTARAQNAALEDDAAAAAVEEQLETMREQIKAALINYPPIMSLLSQFPSFRSSIHVPRDGQSPIGELVLEIEMEHVQGPDDFFQPPTVPLSEIDVTVQMPDGTTESGLTIQLPQS
ncbi:ATP-binding protein [Burkholderia vietnamiensis]|uniref:ATP-binding protein n=1 Tax=Burkholderia vietnamiensis TaxID=60552 RepID=UPI0010415678|nr:ATP-binding protein [Burkholderia vietnamiensis]HDR9026951.1 ABC transporter permease [Burkholderia vietnamiensis]